MRRTGIWHSQLRIGNSQLSMLTSADLKKLISAGPSARIEVLSPATATHERMARSLVALANTRGGVLIVPLGPKVKADPAELRDRALQALLMSEPRLIVPLPYLVAQSAHAEWPDALVIEVPEGLPNVYALEGRYLARENARNGVLNPRALRELMLIRGEGTWESASPSGSSREDLDWGKIDAYAQRILLGGDTVEDLLLRRGCLIKKGRQVKPTYAGLLLFAGSRSAGCAAQRFYVRASMATRWVMRLRGRFLAARCRSKFGAPKHSSPRT